MDIIDLSMPIGPHFRWSPEIKVKGDIAAGDQFRVTHLATTCHGFSPRRRAGAFRRACADHRGDAARRAWSGRRGCSICATSRRTRAIDAARLAKADPGGAEGEILLLSAAWDEKRDNTTAAFWKDAPYLTRDAAEWLLARKPTAVAFDFPQDYPIRLLLDGHDRADGGARDARRAAARRRHADRISGEHVGAERPAHVPVRCAAEDSRRRRRARARVRDRGVGSLTSRHDAPASGRHRH